MADLKLEQCQSCGGIYPRAQRDGTEYYHVCPPRRILRYDPAPTLTDPKATKAVYATIDQPRNANVAGLDENRKAVIVAEGKGVVAVVDPAVIAAYTATLETP